MSNTPPKGIVEKIVIRDISDLDPADYNPRRMTPEQDADLEASLVEFGFIDPVVINKHPDRLDVIVGGHQRIRKWGQLGNKKVPTVEVYLKLKKEKELNIRLNKNVGEWDWEVLDQNFEEIELMDWGFEAKELEYMDPEDKDTRTPPKIEVTHTCPNCGEEFVDKKSEPEE